MESWHTEDNKSSTSLPIGYVGARLRELSIVFVKLTVAKLASVIAVNSVVTAVSCIACSDGMVAGTEGPPALRTGAVPKTV